MENLKELQNQIEEIRIEISHVETNRNNLQETLKTMLEKEHELKQLQNNKNAQIEKERKEKLGKELVNWGKFTHGYVNVELNLFTFEEPIVNYKKQELFDILKKYNCKGVIFHINAYTDRLGYFQMVQQIYEIKKDEIILIFEE